MCVAHKRERESERESEREGRQRESESARALTRSGADRNGAKTRQASPPHGLQDDTARLVASAADLEKAQVQVQFGGPGSTN